MIEIEDVVRSVSFFRDLDRVSVARVVGALEEVHASAGTLVIREGDAADALYLLEQGRISLTIRSTSGEVEVSELRAPAAFGELGILLRRRSATARAATDSRLWRLPRERFEAIVQERPEVALAVAAGLAELLDRRQRDLIGAPAIDSPGPSLSIERATERRPSWTRVAFVIPAIALPLLLWNATPPPGLDPGGWRALLVLLGAAIAWLGEPIPDFAIALAMAATWGATGIAPLATIFGGFATPSWVLALGALTLAGAMAHSGLLFRSTLFLLRRFPATQAGQVLALLVGGVIVTPFVPLSVARVAAIAPVTLELAQAFGARPRSRESAALAFAGLTGYWFLSSVFLTGLATNFFVFELLGPEDRARFGWLGWLGAALPAGAMCFVGAIVAIFWLFRPDARHRVPRDVLHRQMRALGDLSRSERFSLVAVGVLVVGLIAEPILDVEPAWLAVAAVVVVMTGVLDRLRFRTSVDWGFLVLFGLLLGSGGVLDSTGVARWIGGTLLAGAARIADPGLIVMALALVTMAARVVLPSRPTMLLFALVAMPAAPALGISPWVAGFVVLLAANVWVLPAQGLEYLIARDATRGEAFTDRQGMAMGAALVAVRLLALAVSVPYWKALGLVG